MASKIKEIKAYTDEANFDLIDQNSSEYCTDCLYHWCSKRGQVTFCMLKMKGFFECKSCMLKLFE